MTEGVTGPQPIQPPSGGKEAQQVNPKDVQQFVKIQEESRQLEIVLQIAQDITKQKLQESRKRTKEVTVNPQSVSVTGTAEEQGNKTSFNVLQGHVAEEIQSLMNQIQILKSVNPREASILEKQVEEVAKSFPNLSENQANVLNSVTNNLNKLADNGDPDTQATYWDEVSRMYQKMSLNHQQFLEKNASVIDELEAKEPRSSSLGGAKDAQSQLSRFMELFPRGAVGAHVKAALSGGQPEVGATRKTGLGATAGRGSGGSVGDSSGSSLQAKFRDAMFGKGGKGGYIQRQEEQMMALSDLLMYDNNGATIGNAIMNKITGFGSCATDFNFSSSFLQRGVSGSSSTYEGSFASAQAALSREKSTLQSRLESIEAVLQYIKSEIPQATGAIKEGLEQMQKGFEQAKSQLTDFNKWLSKVTVSSAGAGKYDMWYDGKAFTTADVTKFTTFENVTINGNTAQEAKTNGLPVGGGLNKLSSDANTFQQKFADLGQNAQMMLQLNTTEMQQEWSVITTALSTLNQAMLSVGRKISQ